jgi:RNA polymerase sporulation-specific sigma factor
VEVVYVDTGSSDYQLVVQVQSGNERSLEKLVKRYQSFLNYKAGAYYFDGVDRHDIYQECLISFYKAARNYKSGSRCLNFRKFAGLCVDRRMSKLLNSASGFKHKPLSQYQPISKASLTLRCQESDPFRNTMLKEKLNWLASKLGDLTIKEQKVFRLFNQGLSYKDIASKLNSTEKAIDNALQRARQKLRLALRSGEW